MEKWKAIPGYEGIYEVSNFGNIKSLGKGLKGKIGLRSLIDNGIGYKQVTLSKDRKKKTHKVHRLVMLAFIGKSELEVNHKDGNPSNNKLDNLEYCTGSENKKHSYKYLGRKTHLQGKFGEKNHNSKKIIQKTKAGDFIKQWESMADIEREIKIDHSNISAVCNGKRQTTGGYKWEFKT